MGLDVLSYASKSRETVPLILNNILRTLYTCEQRLAASCPLAAELVRPHQTKYWLTPPPPRLPAGNLVDSPYSK